MPDDPDELLTVAEVAERLRMNQQTVRNWIDRGELAGIRLGSRRVRVRASALTEFIEESSSAQAPELGKAEQAYAEAVEAVSKASSDLERAAALRTVARTATRLARAVSR